jgi:hypothetical protein
VLGNFPLFPGEPCSDKVRSLSCESCDHETGRKATEKVQLFGDFDRENKEQDEGKKTVRGI